MKRNERSILDTREFIKFITKFITMNKRLIFWALGIAAVIIIGSLFIISRNLSDPDETDVATTTAEIIEESFLEENSDVTTSVVEPTIIEKVVEIFVEDTARIEELTSSIEELQDQLDETKTLLAAETGDKEVLKSRIDALNASIDALKAQRDTWKQKYCSSGKGVFDESCGHEKLKSKFQKFLEGRVRPSINPIRVIREIREFRESR